MRASTAARLISTCASQRTPAPGAGPDWSGSGPRHLAGFIMKMLIFMSIILVSGFIIMGVQNFWIHIFMVWSLSTTLQLIINLLTDLNSPFEGIWVVENTHYIGIVCLIDKRLTNE